MGLGDMLQAEQDAEDAARYRYVVRNRCWHMLKLLEDGKGSDSDFHKMVDRCIASEKAIRAQPHNVRTAATTTGEQS